MLRIFWETLLNKEFLTKFDIPDITHARKDVFFDNFLKKIRITIVSYFLYDSTHKCGFGCCRCCKRHCISSSQNEDIASMC